MRFKEKVVLVTGSSQNTGLGIAAFFLKEGAKICLNSISEESTSVGAKKLHGMGFTDFLECPADISNEEEVIKMFKKIESKYNRIDILINNACHLGLGPTVEDVEPQDFMDVIKVNVFGTFLVSKYAAKLMLNQMTKGNIINITSFTAEKAIRNRAAYNTSKGGLEALTRSMAVDLASKGIRVNSIAPGYIHTDRWDSISNQTIHRRRQNIPLGQEAFAEDIANAVAFLASAEAKNITGQKLIVDGGCSVQNFPSDCDF